MEHSFIDKYAGLDSPIHRLKPAVKLLSSLIFAVSAVVVSEAHAYILFFHSAMVLILTIVSRIPLLFVLKRALPVVPFVVLPAIGMYLTNSNRDIHFLSLLVLKGMLSASIFIILVSTTRFTAILDLLKRWHLPQPVVSTLSFMYRYIFIIMDQGMRMQRAREMRYFGGFYRRQAVLFANMLSTLFVRSFERGERVYNAMLMRGWGEPSMSHAFEGSTISDGLKRGGSNQVQTAVEALNITAQYPNRKEPVWSGLSFSVPQGSTLIVTGGNGSGKSTLLLALCGIIKTTGEVRILGEVLDKKSLQKLRRNIGLMFEDPEDQLFCPTLYEDVSFGPCNLGLPPEEIERRVKEALEAVDLSGFEERSPHHLSLGEKRLAALATILAMKPQIYLLDEPTANLDRKHKARMLEIIKRLEGTKIIATHDEELFNDMEKIDYLRLD